MAGPWHLQSSRYGSCPFCSLGEEGSEHLLFWCPAVALAWARTRPPGCDLPLLLAFSQGGEATRRATALAHQVVFLHGALAGRVRSTWEEAAAALTRATKRSGAPKDSHPPDDSGSSDPEDSTPPPSPAGAWFLGVPPHCPHCTARSKARSPATPSPPALAAPPRETPS